MSKILVIDDNELISKMLEHSLSEHGYDVRAALDANQGYAAALEFHPNLILLDVQLPDVQGFDLCRVIKNRAELREVPIIMITGTARSTAEKVKGFQMGVDDYVLKPFEMPELLERIKTILRRAEAAQKAHVSPAAPSPTFAQAGKPAAKSAANPVSLERSLKEIFSWALFDPRHVPTELDRPRLSLSYLMAALILTLAGVALTAGDSVKPVMALLWVTGTWGAAVSTLVMSGSIMGMHMKWREGARLISLAGIPILFKMAGGLFLSFITGIAPFYFTASPVLIWTSAPKFVERLDPFEIWSVCLLWLLVRHWPSSTRRRSVIATVLVWLTCAALSLLISKLAGGPPA